MHQISSRRSEALRLAISAIESENRNEDMFLFSHPSLSLDITEIDTMSLTITKIIVIDKISKASIVTLKTSRYIEH